MKAAGSGKAPLASLSSRALARGGGLPQSALRVLRAQIYLRARRVHVGRLPHVRGHLPLIDNGSHISIGDDFRVISRQVPIQLGAGSSGRLTIGDRVFMNSGVSIYAQTQVTIEDDVSIGDFSSIQDTAFHVVNEGDAVTAKPVLVKRNAWIARQVILLPGVTVGEHAVVAAGSVVTRDVPAATLVAGVPARWVKDVHASSTFARRLSEQ